MNLAHDLFLLNVNLAQLHNKEKILQLFVEGMQEIFQPVLFHYVEKSPESGSVFEIRTRKSYYGVITAMLPDTELEVKNILINNSVQMLAIILEHLEFEQNLEEERNGYEKISLDKLKEVERNVKDLEEARSVSINLIEDLSCEIDKRIKAEADLRLISSRNEAILGSVPNIIMEVDNNKIYTWANSSGFEFFGDDVIGKEASFYFVGEQETYGKVEPLFIGTGDKIYVESWQRRIDGEKRLLGWWCKVLKDDKGRVTGVLSSAADVTENKKNEEALKESELKFRNLFEHSPVGKSMTGIDGTINVNKSFCKILGYTEEELKSKNWKEISHPDDVQMTSNIIKSLLDGESDSARFEKKYLHKDGKIVFTDVSTYLQRDNNGTPQFFITTINDITGRMIAEKEIRELNEDLEKKVFQRTAQLKTANNELESFSYSVSHDLRAPLRAIHSYTNILREDYKDILDDEGRRICGIIESSTIRMGQLIDDLLAFSRIGRTELNYSRIDMTNLAKAAWNEITSPKERETINFRVEKLPYAYGDTVTLKQVMINLLSNSIKYTSKKNKPEIIVGCENINSISTYYVKDNGVGFDMQYVDKLFGVFQRLHSAKEFEGNGVGLAIVKRIISRHDGKIWAEAEVGKGATFYFTIPAKKKSIK